MANDPKDFLEELYPDITTQGIKAVAKERKEQYERDASTISENFDEFSSHIEKKDDVAHALYLVKFSKYMDKLFPGYKQMTPARQEECEFRFGLGNLNMTEIDAIYDKITNPEDPMYHPDLSERDAANVASIYAKAYLDSKKDIFVSTGKSTHDPDDWFKPVDETIRVAPSEHEQRHAIENAISEYNKKPKFSIKNILSGVKKHTVTIEAALQARDYLDKALSPSKGIDHNQAKENVGEEK